MSSNRRSAASHGSSRRRKQNDPPPPPDPKKPQKPVKSAKFSATDDDNYCTNMCIMIGPKNKAKHYETLLLALGMGFQFRGYDKLDFALPIEQDEIQALHDELVQRDWKMPAYNIKSGQKQGEYRRHVEISYKAWLKQRESTKNINKVYVNVHDKATVTWGQVQELLSSALQFFRDVWILNPHLTKAKAYTLAMRLLQTHIKNKSHRKHFFKRYIKEKREELAHTLLDGLGETVEGNTFADPVQANTDIKMILSNLGKSTKGSDVECFERLQNWYTELPMTFTTLIERFEWIDPEGDLKLAPEHETSTAEPMDTTETSTAEPMDTTETSTAEPVETTETSTAAEPVETAETSTSAEPVDTAETSTTQPTDTTESNDVTTAESNPDAASAPTSPAAESAPAPAPGASGDTETAAADAETAAAPVPSDEPEIIDLTVDDLKPLEAKISTKAGSFVTALANEGLVSNAPKLDKKGRGGKIRYTKPIADWKTSKTWEYIQIQGLVNNMTTLYGLKVSCPSAIDQRKRGVRCAIKLGFLHTGFPVEKANIAAHLETWLPELLRPSFIPYMAMLEGMISPNVLDKKVVTKNFKSAKSALLNGGSFSPQAKDTLMRIIKEVVRKEQS